MPPKKTTGTPIAELEHADATRRNIPTAEQQEALVDEEQSPPAFVLRRNPALDPQLVWRGKYGDAKRKGDGDVLSVPSLPIYIQEVVRPVALLEELRAEGDAAGQLDLFATQRRKLSDDQRFDFYQHDEDWQNRLILGDSLLVMTSLAEREGLRGKVQMIYFDPPYGIKFGSNWQARIEERAAREDADGIARDPEPIRAFRDTWKDGIHSYLSYLRDRLLVARELLAETGSIFVQIGDENVHRIRVLLDEVFGTENFASMITVKKTAGLGTTAMPQVADYVLWYSKDVERRKTHSLFVENDRSDDFHYSLLLGPGGESRKITKDDRPVRGKVGEWRVYREQILLAAGRTEACVFEFPFQGDVFFPTAGRSWSTNQVGMNRLACQGRIVKAGQTINYVRFANDFMYDRLANVWEDVVSSSAMDKVYVVQTAGLVVQRCMLMSTDPGDLVLDLTCGSGTTASVAEEWGRRWITCDTSRVALSIARTRLLSARLPYYLLADSDEGRAKEQALSGVAPPEDKATNDLRQGFVYERVPHVTLKAIAHNEEIDTIHAAWQPKLDAARAALNALLKKPLEEWEVPRQPEPAWPSETQALLATWWEHRIARQKEIDASIARRADVELLYDQPYEDAKRVRVAGPFTVESLSPHRVIPMGGEQPESEREAQARRGDARFVETVLEHLKKTGVQNGRKAQRLTFERLDPWPGTWLQAVGEAKGGGRVAVCVGPQFGTVGKALLDAAKKEAEAAKFAGVVVVCGMAFEPGVARDADEATGGAGFKLTAVEARSKVEVVPVRITPELTLGMADRLKNTGAGNLFMVFGEPELKVEKQKDGRYTVAVVGMDVYDPAKGVVRSGTAEGEGETFKGDDIACWMLDTAYEGKTFVVRQIYFPGKKDPYEKLKKALKAEIRADAWQSLRGTVSRPFVRPKSGLVAVKVINHYGDEVMKVWRFPS